MKFELMRHRECLSGRSLDRNLCAIIALAAACCTTTGCGGSAATDSPGNPSTKSRPDGTATTSSADQGTAQQILKDAAAAYRKAKTYADAGQVHIRFDRDGKPFEDNLDFSVAFERPNKLRLICYDAMVVSDGKQFCAAVKSVPNQVLQVPAPNVLTTAEVVKDQQLHDTLSQGPAGGPVQLPFLTDDNTVAQLLQDAMEPPKVLESEAIEGQPCHRIEINGSQGRLTLWIDQKNHLIRRISLPPVELKKLLEQNGPVSNVSMIIDFHQARFDQPIDQTAFKFEIPEGAKVAESLVVEIPPATIAPHTDPTAFKLTKLWSAADIKDPGNALVLDGPGGQPKILAFDGWRAVVEIDREGKLIGRHELDFPADAVACFLRTTTDRQGRRFYVVSANGQPQCHVFDENWKRVLSFPRPEDGATEGIGDVQITDLDGSGRPQLCVSYWGDVGVQGVALSGDRLWRDRSLQFVLRTALTDPDAAGHRRLLCTHSKGNIVPLNFEGKPEKEIVVPDRHIYYIVAADLEGKGQSNYLALSGSIVNDNTAVGFTLDGREMWNYTLPAGVHGRPIEVVTSGDITGDATRDWLIAGADGSIHILSADGKPLDKFNTGTLLVGLGAAKLGNQRVLLIASALDKPNGDRKGTLDAWLVEPATN